MAKKTTRVKCFKVELHAFGSQPAHWVLDIRVRSGRRSKTEKLVLLGTDFESREEALCEAVANAGELVKEIQNQIYRALILEQRNKEHAELVAGLIKSKRR